MTTAEVAASFRDLLQTAAVGTAAVVSGRWRQVDPSAVVDSWAELLPGALDDVVRGQQVAAQRGAEYVPEVLAAQGVVPDGPRANARAFSGVASDGRPLGTLFALPAHQAAGRIGSGQAVQDVLESARWQMMMLATTQVQDAGRGAASVGMVGNRQVGGYRRQLTTPSCARCVVLAGKWFRWNTGFQRHPNCDCVHVPAVGPKSDLGGLESFDQQAYFDSLEPAAQDRTFTQAGASAIRDGADIGQVVNARRGMKTTTMYGRKVSTTLEGTTARMSSARRAMERDLGAELRKERGHRYRRLDVPRLTPEQIYADARDRDDAIRLLGRFGYLTG